jgi:transcriptional regulator with XRE-family HTH domain/quercetin dioxygenase-like cupin family protein
MKSNKPVVVAAKTTPQRSKAIVADAGKLSPSFVGARIRERRLASGITLRQFARDLEVSASFISQLETGKVQPSVATLFAICEELGIAPNELFANEEVTSGSVSREAVDTRNIPWATDPSDAGGESFTGATPAVVRPSDRKSLVLDSGVTWESLAPTRDGKTEFMYVTYDVGGSSTMEERLIRHVGTEYGYILKGTLEVTVGFDSYVVGPGDAISFDSSRPHRLRNVGTDVVEAVWFNLEVAL